MSRADTFEYRCDRCGTTSRDPAEVDMRWFEVRKCPVSVGSEYRGPDLCTPCIAELDRFLLGADVIPEGPRA